jgi:hypothetical protein
MGLIVGSGLKRFRKHVSEQVVLQRHRMRASLVRKKEFTVAVKDALIEGDMVIVVIAAEGQFEPGEAEAFRVF